jgi:hypothetical protein
MPGRLEHSPARIIQEFLILYGFGIDPNDWMQSGDIPNGVWPIYEGRCPDRPDDIIQVTGTVGRDFGYTQLDSERQEMYGIQILVRSHKDSYAYLKAQDIAVLGIDRIRRVEFAIGGTEVGSGTGTGTGTGSGGMRYIIHSVFRTSEAKFEGRDTPQGKRVNYSINAIASIRMCP